MFIYLSLSLSQSPFQSVPLYISGGVVGWRPLLACLRADFLLLWLSFILLLHVKSSSSGYLKAAFCFYSLLDVIISMVVIRASLKPARSFAFHPVTLFLHLFPNCKSNTSLRNQFSRIPVPSRIFTDNTILSFPPDRCTYKGKHL